MKRKIHVPSNLIRFILSFCLLFVLLPAATLNAEAETESNELVWNIGSEPGNWDPQLTSMSGAISIAQNMWEGLMIDTEDGLKQGLAESYEITPNKDGVENTVYTFKLREGLKWSDGSPLVAQDFIDSWMRAIEPKTAAAYAFLFTDYIVGAEEYYNGEGKKEDIAFSAPDEKTIQIELKHPTPYFLNLVAFAPYMATKSSVSGEDGWEKDPEKCVCSGPFKLQEYKIGDHLSLVKNEAYWNADNVKLSGIKVLMIAEASTALSGYKSGEIQIVDNVPQEEIPKLLAEDPNFTSSPAIGSMFYSFNMDKEPTNDLNVRKALTLAVDRKALTEQVLRGGQLPASAYVPPSFSNSDGSSFRKLDESDHPVEEYGIDPNAAQVEEAKKYLADAGYPDGKGFPTLELLYDVNENNKKVAEAIQEMWKKNLNINVELRSEEWKVFVVTRYNGKFQVCRGGWNGDYNDPMTMFDLFTSRGINYSQWRWQPYSDRKDDTVMNPENKAYEEELNKAMSSTGKERDAYLHKAEDILMDNAVVMPLYYNAETYIVDYAKVDGLGRTATGAWDFRGAELFD